MRKYGWLILVGLMAVVAGWLLRPQRDSLLRRAEAAYRHGDYTEAARLYALAAAEGGDTEHAVFNLGAALYAQGAFTQASRRFLTVTATGERERRARALYDAANCGLQLACRSPSLRSKPFLEWVIGQYEASLHQAGTGDGTLPQDARHNLELAKRLLASLSPSDRVGQNRDAGSAGKQDSVSERNEGEQVAEQSTNTRSLAMATKALPEEELCPT